ncbi:MAG: hypothetical protein J5804_00350 [Eggerthellaceae bacterium]|nr:hypothetical protein [Eggerthellaceae bacterium]
MKTIAKLFACACVIALAFVLAGCSSGGSGSQAASSKSAPDIGLENGTYSVEFNTDSSMFHINEADEGKGVLTVTDDGATVHVRLVSKKIVNVYSGTAKEAEADAAGVIQPTTDTVTYSDGMTKEVYGFDIPVPALDEEFDVAILGEKGTWYDHKVSVSDPVEIEQ